MRPLSVVRALAMASALLVVGTVDAHAAASPLTPVAASTQHDIVVPLAGSATTLVMSRQVRYSRDVNESASAEPPYSSAPVELYARSGTGRLVALGTRPDTGGYSLAGTTLAAGRPVDADTVRTNEAYVWSTITGRRSEVTLPVGDVYLAAAPGGVLFVTAHGVLRVRTVGGSTTTLATPFGTTTIALVVSAAVDADRAVVTDFSGHIATVGFAAPHTVTPLTNPQPGSPLACYQVVGGDAACALSVRNDDDGSYFPVTPVLEPVDGSVPTVADVGSCSVSSPALAGTTELWTCRSGQSADQETFTLDSATAGSSQVTTSTTPRDYPLVSAYGKAVDSSPLQDSLYAATTATTVATLVPTRPSPVTVDAFALTSTRLLYSDDQRVAARPGEVESVFERTVHVTSSGVHGSAPSLVSPGTSDVSGNLIGLSPSLRVYATVGTEVQQFRTVILHVQRGRRTITLSHVIGQGAIQVSGDRVLYQRAHGNGTQSVVYDAATGRTVVAETLHNAIDYNGIALSGHHVAYATRHGAIYRKDLLTSKRVLLRKALPHDVGGVDFDVYAFGHWVGWHALPVEGELAAPLNQVRDVATMARPVSLPHTLFSLTSAGAVLASSHASFRAVFSEVDQVPSPTRFWLRSHAGKIRSLLPKASYVAGPQIAGNVLAWGDAKGVLRAKPLPGH